MIANRSLVAGLLLLSVCAAANAQSANQPSPLPLPEAPARELNLVFSGGKTMLNWHGNDTFRSLRLELVTPHRPRLLKRFASLRLGMAAEYHYVRQPRSWFGFDGDPILRVKAGSANLFARRVWDHARYQTYVDVGTGPMWGTERMPAATSHFNFESQLGLGVVISPRSSAPVHIGYRFAHVSNAGIAPRNPGLNLHTLFIGFRLQESR